MSTKTATTAPAQVNSNSLPLSLRHILPAMALDDARNITAFLHEVTSTPRIEGLSIADSTTDNWQIGLGLCFMLLTDKLDIAAGAYKFPLASIDSEAPDLCERIE